MEGDGGVERVPEGDDGIGDPADLVGAGVGGIGGRILFRPERRDELEVDVGDAFVEGKRIAHEGVLGGLAGSGRGDEHLCAGKVAACHAGEAGDGRLEILPDIVVEPEFLPCDAVRVDALFVGELDRKRGGGFRIIQEEGKILPQAARAVSVKRPWEKVVKSWKFRRETSLFPVARSRETWVGSFSENRIGESGKIIRKQETGGGGCLGIGPGLGEVFGFHRRRNESFGIFIRDPPCVGSVGSGVFRENHFWHGDSICCGGSGEKGDIFGGWCGLRRITVVRERLTAGNQPAAEGVGGIGAGFGIGGVPGIVDTDPVAAAVRDIRHLVGGEVDAPVGSHFLLQPTDGDHECKTRRWRGRWIAGRAAAEVAQGNAAQ